MPLESNYHTGDKKRHPAYHAIMAVLPNCDIESIMCSMSLGENDCLLHVMVKSRRDDQSEKDIVAICEAARVTPFCNIAFRVYPETRKSVNYITNREECESYARFTVICQTEALLPASDGTGSQPHVTCRQPPDQDTMAGLVPLPAYVDPTAPKPVVELTGPKTYPAGTIPARALRRWWP